MEGTEALIQCVERHSCLYDPRNKDYKNYTKKCLLWDEIAKDLNQTSEAIKLKWKNLRDGYTKYKKLTKGTSKVKKKYQNWVWGPYLKFLNPCLRSEKRTDQSSPRSLSPGQSASRSSPPLPEQPEPQESDPRVSQYSDPLSLQQSPLNSSPGYPWYALPSPSHQLPLQTLLTSPKKTNETDNGEDDDTSSYFKNKSDSIDLLFMSYAETFRKFNPRTRASLKVKLAQMFADAEISEIEGSVAKRPKAEPL